MTTRRVLAILICLLGLDAGGMAAEGWRVPTAVKKLSNGLVVVVSEDHSAPPSGYALATG